MIITICILSMLLLLYLKLRMFWFYKENWKRARQYGKYWRQYKCWNRKKVLLRFWNWSYDEMYFPKTFEELEAEGLSDAFGDKKQKAKLKSFRKKKK